MHLRPALVYSPSAKGANVSFRFGFSIIFLFILFTIGFCSNIK